jgi:hypothetical protein
VSLPSTRHRADGSSPAEVVGLELEGADAGGVVTTEPLATGSGAWRHGLSPTTSRPRATATRNRSSSSDSATSSPVEVKPEGAEVRGVIPGPGPVRRIHQTTGSGIRRLGWSPTVAPRPTEAPRSYADASRISVESGQFDNFSLASSSSVSFNEGPPATMLTPVGAFLARERPFINATASPPLPVYLAGPSGDNPANESLENDNDETLLANPSLVTSVVNMSSLPRVSQGQGDSDSVVSFLSCAPNDSIDDKTI